MGLDGLVGMIAEMGDVDMQHPGGLDDAGALWERRWEGR